MESVFREKNHCRSKTRELYTERTHPVDVLGALDGELRQSGDVELSAAVRVHLDVQLVGEVLPQQVPDQQQRHLQAADVDSGLMLPAAACRAGRSHTLGVKQELYLIGRSQLLAPNLAIV